MLYTKIFAVGLLISLGYLFFPELTAPASETPARALAKLLGAIALPLIAGGIAAALLDQFWYPSNRAGIIAAGGALIAAITLGVLQPFGVTPSVRAAIAGLVLMPSMGVLAAIIARGILRALSGRRG